MKSTYDNHPVLTPDQEEKLAAAQSVLKKYTSFLSKPSRAIVGREQEMRTLNAVFYRPEICNAILLGEAGSGKTMLVQGLMVRDRKRKYLELNLERMIAEAGSDVAEKLASQIRILFEAVKTFTDLTGRDLVIFIDEFHKIIQLSPAAIETIKPILASSGTHGLRIVAATTYEEFRQWIAPNQPLVERLERINIQAPDRDTTISILKNMAEQYGVKNKILSDNIYDLIYEYTDRYIPADSQPRKSLKVLESMIGWNLAENAPMDRRLLTQVIRDSVGANVNFSVDASSIKKKLDSVIMSQDYVTTRLEEQLQVAAANLQDKNRPMASFLFAGSTGTGKTETARQLGKILFGTENSLIRFDMTEYALEDSIDRFRSELTRQIWEHPHSILLLDEVEKAAKSVTHLLLQVLDDGRLIDEYNREVSFVNSYIILTTNAGRELYENIASYYSDDAGSGSTLRDLDATFRKSLTQSKGDKFPPELLGRIDVIIPFQPLTDETRLKICRLKINGLIADVKTEHSVILKVNDEVSKFLAFDETSIDPNEGGARSMIRQIRTQLTPAVSKFIFDHPNIRYIEAVLEGTPVYKDQSIRKSDARIVVRAFRPGQEKSRRF